MSPQAGVDLQAQVQGGGLDLQVRPKGRTCKSGKDLTPWPQLANPWSKKPLGLRGAIGSHQLSSHQLASSYRAAGCCSPRGPPKITRVIY